jgi:hypothetical protein
MPTQGIVGGLMRYEKVKDSIQYLDMPLSSARIRERAGLGVWDTLVPAPPSTYQHMLLGIRGAYCDSR